MISRLAVLCLGFATIAAGQDPYERGVELTEAKRDAEARAAFVQGARRFKADKRFPLALAGLDYRSGNNGEAMRQLRRALRIDANDVYANDFLASLYLLDGNVEAAVKFWNRAGKPRVEQVRFVPDPPAVREGLLDRAIAFAPASVLQLEEYRETERALAMIEGVRSRIDLAARQEKDFDVELTALEMGAMARRLSWLASLPFLAVNLDWRNIRRSGAGVENFVRFDPDKRRLRSAFWTPLGGDVRRQLKVYGDARRERWNFGGGDVNFEKTAGGAEFTTLLRGRVRWDSGFEGGSQRFADGPKNGPFVKYRSGLSADLLRVPERRLRVEGWAGVELGRMFGDAGGGWRRVEASAVARWQPAAGYELGAQIRGGVAGGALPLDETFQIGVERDTPLWLRGHAGTIDGKKGSAILGRRYGLANIDAWRRVYGNGLVRVDAGPFGDIALARDLLARFGDRRVFVNVGAQVRVSVLGAVGLRLSYGRDLRSGRGVFYAAR